MNKLLEDAKKYITEETVKQVFFYCDNKNPNGIYVDDADLMEFSEKIIAVVGKAIADDERTECLKIVEALNPEIARVIRDRRG